MQLQSHIENIGAVFQIHQQTNFDLSQTNARLYFKVLNFKTRVEFSDMSCESYDYFVWYTWFNFNDSFNFNAIGFARAVGTTILQKPK